MQKGERNLHLDKKKKKQNKSQITKKLKEKIKAKVFCRWVLCFSVFSQSIIETIEVDEVSCIAFRYGTNFAIHYFNSLLFHFFQRGWFTFVWNSLSKKLMITDGCGWFSIEKHVEMKFLTIVLCLGGYFSIFLESFGCRKRDPTRATIDAT